MNAFNAPAARAELHFNHGYRETAVLRDGHEVTLRLICPTDKELLRRGFERLSPESRYRRFFSAKHTLSDAELAYLTELDGFNHFAIVAITRLRDGAEDGLGIARFFRSQADPRVAEAAVTVVDDWQNKGLGTLLLLRLVAAARERGIQRFESRALADNAALRDVLAPLGPVVNMRRDSDEVVIDVGLPDVPNDAFSDATVRQAAHHRILSLVARGSIAVRKALENLERIRSA